MIINDSNSSKRTDIINELVARLKVLQDPSGTAIPVSRGFRGPDVKDFPSIWLFEDTENVRSPSRDGKPTRSGLYTRTLPVQVEYFQAITSFELYEAGNAALVGLQTAIELDERFQQGLFAGTPAELGSDLCTWYGMVRNMVLKVRDNIMLVVVVYEFDYYAKFKGYHGRR